MLWVGGRQSQRWQNSLRCVRASIGQAFDGTQLPFLIGLATCAIAGLVGVLITERGRLFGGIDVVPEPLAPQSNLAD